MEDLDSGEWYEILDELNARLEEIFNECYESQACELILPKIHQKVQEFIADLEHEKETIEFINMNR